MQLTRSKRSCPAWTELLRCIEREFGELRFACGEGRPAVKAYSACAGYSGSLDDLDACAEVHILDSHVLLAWWPGNSNIPWQRSHSGQDLGQYCSALMLLSAGCSSWAHDQMCLHHVASRHRPGSARWLANMHQTKAWFPEAQSLTGNLEGFCRVEMIRLPEANRLS